MKIEKIYLDWDKVYSFQSDGEDKCFIFLTDTRVLKVRHSFKELQTMKNTFTIDSDIVLDLIDD